MNSEPGELNRERQIEYFRSQYPIMLERYQKLRKHIEEDLNKRRSNFIDITSPSITFLGWNYDILNKQGPQDVDLEEVTNKMRAMQDYFELMENNPGFFQGELTFEGNFSDIRRDVDLKVEEAHKAGERFDRAAYYVDQVKKRLDK